VLQVRGIAQQLLAGELLPDDHLAAFPQCHQVEARLAQVDANGMNLHVMILLPAIIPSGRSRGGPSH
jgi:hypothetical protein